MKTLIGLSIWLSFLVNIGFIIPMFILFGIDIYLNGWDSYDYI